MAAYKKDINLFKAAGGERAKSKKMAATKKLVLVAVLVIILVAGGIGALLYFNNVYTKKLDALKKTKENYEHTQSATTTSVEEYKSVQTQINTAVLIEYQSMLNAGFSSDLSAEELKAVRAFLALETTPFTIDNHFEDVVDEVLRQLNLKQYADAGETFADDVYSAKFLYGALSYMKTMQPVFAELPLQYVEDGDEDEYYWYCYYRGKFVMMLRNTGGDAAALAQQLQSPADLGCDPFCSLAAGAGSSLSSDFSLYSTVTVGEGAESYTVIAVTCKTIAERFVDSVENIYAQQDLTDGYKMNNYKFADGIFSVDFTMMNQSADFRLKNVCDAVASSPFFVSKNDFAYEITDSFGSIERNLKFMVTNEAVNATKEAAISFFAVDDEEE